MSALLVTDARARRRARRPALRGRRDDRGARSRPRARARRGDARRRGRDPRPAAGQRPHPRRDDALPRQRRRPAADALAGGTDLAGRGEARGRRRLLGRAARLPGDDPLRHDPLLGHVLAPRGDRAGGRRRRAAGGDRRADVRQRPRRGGGAGRGTREPRGADGDRRPDHRRARPALDLHGQRGVAALPRRALRGDATPRSRSTSPRRSPRSTTASANTAGAPPPTSTTSAC